MSVLLYQKGQKVLLRPSVIEASEFYQPLRNIPMKIKQVQSDQYIVSLPPGLYATSTFSFLDEHLLPYNPDNETYLLIYGRKDEEDLVWD